MIPYLLNLALMLGVMVLAWPFSVARKDPSYIDAIWPLGFLVLALSSLLFAGADGATWYVALVAIWALRLGHHLFTRWQHEGPDKRYQKLLERSPPGKEAIFMLVAVFLLQGVLLWLTALPIQHAVREGASYVAPAAIAGIVLFAIGLAFEVIGDRQLAAFKADPANKGQVMDTGLWRYTRHPNYFGNAVLFWGLWLIAVADGDGWWTIIGPIFLTFTLTRWTGAKILEDGLHESRPGYADYVARTSGFVPWWPKRG